MSKRVIQVAIDIMIDENKGYDSQMEKDIAEILENQGYAVVGIGFVDDMTKHYKDFLDE